jgi:hypothetical protein
MKPAGLFALFLSLVPCATPAAEKDWVGPAPGPLARSIAAEAARLAAIQPKADADDVAWAKEEKLDRGTEVAVLDREGNRVHGHLAEADDDSLQLRDGALTNRLRRADVLEIAALGPGSGSTSAATGFAITGAVAALFIDTGLMFSRCNGSCDGNVAMMVGVTAGLPLAGGFGGYYGFRKPAQRVVYPGPSTD